MRSIPRTLAWLVPFALSAQGDRIASAAPAKPAASATSGAGTATAVATRAVTAPVIDGKEDDEIWSQAQVIDGFRQFSPTEDGTASFRTTVKVAYDTKYLFVFVRMYDPHPDSIIGLLSRRDVKTQSDWIKLIIDSYHDRRSGYELMVNPLGVMRDAYTYNDEQEDDSWDGIWDVATRIDSAGWTAEFRVPLDQLRYSPGADITMGFGVWRDIARLNERDSWPAFYNSRQGISSQLGEITGLQGLGSPNHLELVPYAVAKNITYPSNVPETQFERQQQFTGGADIKYGVTSNLTLDGTINPDFGQVESDPAVLNLTNVETFLPERRPFFVEGMGIFRFDMAGNNGMYSGLFYSRRIGRQPQLSNGEVGTPTATTILGAAKLTGRTGGGLSLGILDAYTAKELNAPDTITGQVSTAEPPTNYFAMQAIQEFRGGQTSIGAMVTAVNRDNDTFTDTVLRRSAYSGGIDFDHQFVQRMYEVRAYAIASAVYGSDSAIAFTQQNSAHYYQRPGDGLVYDPTRTSLTGDAEKLSFSKNRGTLHFWTALQRISPGFEVNDLGYLSFAGISTWNNWIGLQYLQPTNWYRTLLVDFSENNSWTSQGLEHQFLSGTVASIAFHLQLLNSWTLATGMDYNQFFGVYDAWKARGGPAMFRHPFTDGFIGFQGDPRLAVIPSVEFDAFSGSGGKSRGWGLGPQLDFRFSSSVHASVAVRYDLNVNYQEWVGNGYQKSVGAGFAADTVWTFATLDQNTLSAVVRFDATFTPRLSYQLYVQPYISSGRYDTWREVVQPRSKQYSVQFAPFPDSVAALYPIDLDPTLGDYNFNFQQLNVNSVLRWEYRPGSALYVVWTHGRTYDNTNQAYQGFYPGTDWNHLFSVHPMNTFLIKATYWIGL